MKFGKDDFVGKDALTEQKALGLTNQVVYFTLEGRRIAREGSSILGSDGVVVGRVLSGTLSPMTGGPIGSALIATEALGEPLAVDLRGHSEPLHIAQPPLHLRAKASQVATAHPTRPQCG